MKIVQVCSGVDQLQRGAEKFCLKLSVSLGLSGHDVTLLSGNHVPENASDLPITCRTIPQATNKLTRKFGLDYVNPTSLTTFNEIIDTIQPDIIHFHSLYGLSTALICSATQRHPVLVTLHDSWLAFVDASLVTPRFGLANSYFKVPHGFVHRKLNRYLIKKATLISPSLWMKKYFEDLGFQTPVHINNGIDPKETQTAYSNTIMWVGTIDTFKGLPTIIDIVSIILARTGWTFVVVGDGPLRLEMQKKYPMVNFVGHRDPDLYFNNSSILIVSSIGYENFPTVILEAMRSGLCVLGHKLGGIAELIRHNETGFLYHSLDSFETTLLSLINDPEQLRRIGSAARTTFEENYLWNTCYKRYLGLYSSVTEDDR